MAQVRRVRGQGAGEVRVLATHPSERLICQLDGRQVQAEGPGAVGVKVTPAVPAEVAVRVKGSGKAAGTDGKVS